MQEAFEIAHESLSEPRIQGVAYLNAWPVLYGLMLGKEPERLRMALPSVLAQRLLKREVDVALAPVATLFLRPGFELVPGICLGADGEVLTVLIVGERPLEEMDKLLLDTSSGTSVILAQLVAGHVRRGRSIEIEPADPARIAREARGGTGAVLIGDPAFAARHAFPYFLDLGAAWKAWTGLPFVFAAWIAQAGVLDEGVIGMLEHSVTFGLGARRDIAHLWAAQHGGEPAFYERYLTAHMQYRLEPHFEAGLSEFLQRAQRAGLAPEASLRFAGR
ncbi:MAG: menaquinone biosynthesis protein [Myxococcales bacterium]